MIAVDSSVVIAAFSSWHERHPVAVDALRRRPHLPAHAGAEAYSVLTRLPAPHRAPPGLVHRFLASAFDDRLLAAAGATTLEHVRELAERAIAGGATYDGLIGLAARESGSTLLTLDVRALDTYRRLGVAAEAL